MAVLRKTVTVLQCERCGYEWFPKNPQKLPDVCSNRECKSPYWNRPRQRLVERGTRKRRQGRE
jgi:hypothetical protein